MANANRLRGGARGHWLAPEHQRGAVCLTSPTQIGFSQPRFFVQSRWNRAMPVISLGRSTTEIPPPQTDRGGRMVFYVRDGPFNRPRPGWRQVRLPMAVAGSGCPSRTPARSRPIDTTFARGLGLTSPHMEFRPHRLSPVDANFAYTLAGPGNIEPIAIAGAAEVAAPDWCRRAEHGQRQQQGPDLAATINRNTPRPRPCRPRMNGELAAPGHRSPPP